MMFLQVSAAIATLFVPSHKETEMDWLFSLLDWQALFVAFLSWLLSVLSANAAG